MSYCDTDADFLSMCAAEPAHTEEELSKIDADQRDEVAREDEAEEQQRRAQLYPYLMELIEAMVDDEKCVFDHHGSCQNHFGELDGRCADALGAALILSERKLAG